jgi:N-acylneuraminate cytidylyltransferase
MKALILARGGSKGVPGKNIKLLGRKPLLAWPILAAQKTRQITEIYVSTDSDEIKKVALYYNAKVIDRPSELAQDTSEDIEAFIHATINQDWNEDPIIHLRATTPILDPVVLDKAITTFRNDPKCTSLRSAHKFPESIYKFFFKDNKYWKSLNLSTSNKPRQSFPDNYLPNGYIDIVKPSWFLNGDNLHGNKILAFITEHAIEIDSQEDFEYAEWKISKNEL